MSQAKKPTKKQPHSEKFKKAVRKLKADEDEEMFADKLWRLMKPKRKSTGRRGG